MKKRTVLLALLLGMMLLAASCQKQTDPSLSGSSPNEAATPAQTTEAPKETESAEEPESGESEAPIEESAETPVFDVLATSYGEQAVSDDEYVYFTVHTDDDPYSINSDRDGLYRAELNMANPVRLARGDCHSLVLEGDNLYFYLEDTSGDCSICCVDRQGTEIRRIVRDVKNASSLGIQSGKLFFVYGSGLYVVDDPETGDLVRVDERIDLVIEARPTGEGQIWFSEVDPQDHSIWLNYYDPTDGTLWRVVGMGSGFCVDEAGTVYYRYVMEDREEFEDDRRYDSILMRMDQIGDPHTTELIGRIAGDLYAYGPYLFYTKYMEVEEWAGDSEATVRKLFCYDTKTGIETMLPKDEFIGFDIEICGITGGRLFYNVYDYHSAWYPDELEFVECRSCPLNPEGGDMALDALTSAASASMAVEADDEAIRQAIALREREREEEERRRQEELNNTPYGPGTSTLYLSAGESRSACYRLVCLNGTTQFQVLLSPGEDTTQTFPCGKYVLKVARGDTWISDEEAFGSSGSYSTTEIFEFEAGASYKISSGTQGDFRGDSQAGFTG